MRLAVISDIHSNFEALVKAIDLIEEQSVDEIICLGDIVGYGANPNECIELVRDRCGLVLLGNHDAAAVDQAVADTFTKNARIAATWTFGQLTEENKRYLSSLPYTAKRDDFLFVHASPYQPEAWYYVISEEDVEAAFQSFSERLCFIGHTHYPGVFSEEGPVPAVTKSSRHLVNVGSVGQPRDGNAKLSFGIFDTVQWEYRNMRSQYPIDVASEKIIAAGLPHPLADRLFLGR